MPRRKRPIVDIGHEPVFHRVRVDVFDMRREVVRVGDHVLPEPALPDPAFARAPAGHGIRLSRQAAREARLDAPPSTRKVRVAFGQGPDAMQVVGSTQIAIVSKGWRSAASA